MTDTFHQPPYASDAQRERFHTAVGALLRLQHPDVNPELTHWNGHYLVLQTISSLCDLGRQTFPDEPHAAMRAAMHAYDRWVDNRIRWVADQRTDDPLYEASAAATRRATEALWDLVQSHAAAVMARSEPPQPSDETLVDDEDEDPPVVAI